MGKKLRLSNKIRKRKGKDFDEIASDLREGKRTKFSQLDADLPGDGQFYCIECSRYFIDEATIIKHKNSKIHRRRVKALMEEPYSQREAERAAGLGV
ncbi:unnamed protein product [Dracunculus medinensis]|uniref:Zinc finger protein 593 homolog n=1 Tax=Dracunculus medinensis TaxID=318479 RepID=A0A158Q336_DRAME|nr:unnamed protein product [Dracunculus medinensis]